MNMKYLSQAKHCSMQQALLNLYIKNVLKAFMPLRPSYDEVKQRKQCDRRFKH